MGKEQRIEFPEKSPLSGNWVAVMERERRERNLKLSDYKTRCVRKGEIHEFLVCSTPWQERKSTINHVFYLGFAEFTSPGVISLGDTVTIPGTNFTGFILGFDETHMPNHQNIVISTLEPCSGHTLGVTTEHGFLIENDTGFLNEL